MGANLSGTDTNHFSVPSHKSAITFFISDLTCEIGVVLGLFLSNLQHLCPVTGQWLAREWAHAWFISASRFPSSILGKVERALKGGLRGGVVQSVGGMAGLLIPVGLYRKQQQNLALWMRSRNPADALGLQAQPA